MQMRIRETMCVLAVVAILPLLPGCTSMRRNTWYSIRNSNSHWHEYNKTESAWVEVPTEIGTIVGIPTAVLAPVVWVLTAPSRSGLEGLEDLYGPILFFPELVGNVVAVPFLGIKKAFVDCPRALFGAASNVPPNETENGKHED